MKSNLFKVSMVFAMVVMLFGCGGGGGGGGGTTTPTPTATPTPTPAPATNVTINSINDDTCASTIAYVTVTDEYNDLVANLGKSDFTVLVDGVSLGDDFTWSFVESANTPVSVAFVMDFSRSTVLVPAILNSEKDAVIGFINQMEADDEGEIIRFLGDEHEVTETFTSDHDALIEAVNSTYTVGSGTDILTPLFVAVTDTSARTGRGAVIILTDGFHNYDTNDTPPTPTVDNVIDLAVANDVPIFTIGYLFERDDLRVESDRAVLQRLAEETGGVYLEAPSTGSFTELYQQISDLIQNQYEITFNGVGGAELQIRVDNGGVIGQSEIEEITGCIP